MRYIKYLISVVILTGILFSCKSQFDALLASNDVNAKYKAAFNYFNAGKYQKAASLFESLAILTTNTFRDDTVQYYWGLSNYKYKDYYTAEANFNKFITQYPNSPLAQNAKFYRIDCLYNQTLRYELDPSPAYKAITAMNEFVTDYPKSEFTDKCYEMLKDLGARLDKKSYEGALLYYRMEDYKSSRVAFSNILKDDPTNIFREQILYYIAMSSYKYANLSVPSKQKERYLTFIDDYFNFVGEAPQSGYRKQLDAMYARAQKSLGKYVSKESLKEGLDGELERAVKKFEKKLKK